MEISAAIRAHFNIKPTHVKGHGFDNMYIDEALVALGASYNSDNLGLRRCFRQTGKEIEPDFNHSQHRHLSTHLDAAMLSGFYRFWKCHSHFFRLSSSSTYSKFCPRGKSLALPSSDSRGSYIGYSLEALFSSPNLSSLCLDHTFGFPVTAIFACPNLRRLRLWYVTLDGNYWTSDNLRSLAPWTLNRIILRLSLPIKVDSSSEKDFVMNWTNRLWNQNCPFHTLIISFRFLEPWQTLYTPQTHFDDVKLRSGNPILFHPLMSGSHQYMSLIANLKVLRTTKLSAIRTKILARLSALLQVVFSALGPSFALRLPLMCSFYYSVAYHVILSNLLCIIYQSHILALECNVLNKLYSVKVCF